mmetsp:Transcript_43201/g.115579  ORF Transcript_43201/g.115579 Transcript_43201/m.115579 type:complete len:203 (+) Transcript_43201:130-738(+)
MEIVRRLCLSLFLDLTAASTPTVQTRQWILISIPSQRQRSMRSTSPNSRARKDLVVLKSFVRAISLLLTHKRISSPISPRSLLTKLTLFTSLVLRLPSLTAVSLTILTSSTVRRKPGMTWPAISTTSPRTTSTSIMSRRPACTRSRVFGNLTFPPSLLRRLLRSISQSGGSLLLMPRKKWNPISWQSRPRMLRRITPFIRLP